MKTIPTYNLNVVVRDTGVKPDTLRAWERRYGLPDPSRTEGGHRLYSERDIATVQWLVERQKEGLRISHAVDLWNQMVSNGQDPFLLKPVGTPVEKIDTLQFEDTPAINELRERWVNACVRFDEFSAVNTANYAFALYPVETVCFDIFLAGLAEIGNSWYQGEVSVQQEHFASSLVIRRLNALIASTSAPTRNEKILIACPPGEEHTISSLTISLLLRQRGWAVVYLGANVPMARFKETVDSVNPNLVVMTAQQLPSAASLLEPANYLAQNNYPFAYGGLIFNQNPGILKIIPGNYLGNNLKTAVDMIEKLLFSPPPIPKVARSQTEYQKELNQYNEIRAAIEYQVARKFGSENDLMNYLEEANHFLSQIIEAIIILGNADLIISEVSWIDELISTKQIKRTSLKTYLSEYYSIANQILGNENKIAIAALEKTKTVTGKMS